MASAEQNYGVEKAEMFVIVETYKHWRHYIERTTYDMQVMTNHLNLRKFLTTKTFSCRKIRWWKRFSSLDFAIKYCEGKNNPMDKLFCHPDYMDKNNKPMHIVGYVIYLSAKRKAQKISKKNSQASKELGANTEPNNPESLLNDETSLKPNFNENFSSDLKSELLVLHLLAPPKKVFYKLKQGAHNKNTTLKKSKKIQTKAK